VDGRDTFRLTYDEIKAVLGFDMDHSFLTFKLTAKDRERPYRNDEKLWLLSLRKYFSYTY
jgi:hypothetical protein